MQSLNKIRCKLFGVDLRDKNTLVSISNSKDSFVFYAVLIMALDDEEFGSLGSVESLGGEVLLVPLPTVSYLPPLDALSCVRNLLGRAGPGHYQGLVMSWVFLCFFKPENIL